LTDRHKQQAVGRSPLRHHRISAQRPLLSPVRRTVLNRSRL